MNKKEKALFLGHFILLLLELLVVLHAFSEEGWTTLRFYTTDSNFLCGIASLLYILKKFPKLNQEGKGVVSGYFQKPIFNQFLENSSFTIFRIAQIRQLINKNI